MYRQVNQRADLHSLEQNPSKEHLILDLDQVHLAEVHLVVVHLGPLADSVQRQRPDLDPGLVDLVH